MSSLAPDSTDSPNGKQRRAAIDYANQQLADHRRAESWHQWGFYLFQTLTVVAAAVATVMAVSDTSDIAPEIRAIPPAVATLGASVLAAFQFRGAWVRHVAAVRKLNYELLKFENELREYRRTKPAPEPEGVDAFLQQVQEISRAGHGEASPEAASPENPVE